MLLLFRVSWLCCFPRLSVHLVGSGFGVLGLGGLGDFVWWLRSSGLLLRRLLI